MSNSLSRHSRVDQDFVTFELAARTGGGRFLERYAEWKQAFELAADGGMVCFH